MAGNMYLGNASDLASNMGSMFGQNSLPANRVGRVDQPNHFNPRVNQPHQSNPFGSTQRPPFVAPNPGPPHDRDMRTPLYNPLGAQAVRPTTTGNFDPSYSQNLATAAGGMFQRPQQPNTALQFNPYGNMGDVNANVPMQNLGGGNAPLQGLPQTLLQWAQWFNPSALGNKVG